LKKQMMVFPFTVPLDGSGRMLDAAQGVYARSLARTLAERLSEPPRLQANLAQLTADGPLDGENGLRGHGWVVASQPWTLEEACHIGLPDGTEYVLHGSAELTDGRRLVGDEHHSSTARIRAITSWGEPSVCALAEGTYFAGLRKAGLPEE
jgi:hypothetical protein